MRDHDSLLATCWSSAGDAASDRADLRSPVPLRERVEAAGADGGEVVAVRRTVGPRERGDEVRVRADEPVPEVEDLLDLRREENPEVSFSGFRLVRVRDDVIERVDFVSRVALDESGWNASLEELTAPPPPRTHRLLPRSERVAHPPSGGGVATLVGADGVGPSTPRSRTG